MAQLQLNRSARRGSLEEVSLILHHAHRLISAQDEYGCTTLHHATYGGHVHVIKYLIDNGAPLNHKDLANETALHWACDKGHVQAVEVLLHSGADVTMRGNRGRTPLATAALKGRVEVVKFLINRHIRAYKCDCTCVCGCVPMSKLVHTCVSREGHDEGDVATCVKALAQEHAKLAVELRDSDGSDAGATEVNHPSVQRESAIATGASALEKVADTMCDASHESVLDARDDAGQSALHHAVSWNHTDIVRVLLEAGSDPWARDNHGRTAYQLTKAGGRSRVPCRLLIEEWGRAYTVYKARQLSDVLPSLVKPCSDAEKGAESPPTYLSERWTTGTQLPSVCVCDSCYEHRKRWLPLVAKGLSHSIKHVMGRQRLELPGRHSVLQGCGASSCVKRSWFRFVRTLVQVCGASGEDKRPTSRRLTGVESATASMRIREMQQKVSAAVVKFVVDSVKDDTFTEILQLFGAWSER